MARQADFKKLWEIAVNIYANSITDSTAIGAFEQHKQLCEKLYGAEETNALLQRAYENVHKPARV